MPVASLLLKGLECDVVSDERSDGASDDVSDGVRDVVRDGMGDGMGGGVGDAEKKLVLCRWRGGCCPR